MTEEDISPLVCLRNARNPIVDQSDTGFALKLWLEASLFRNSVHHRLQKAVVVTIDDQMVHPCSGYPKPSSEYV